MINQARQKTGVVNVYVAIGQKLSKIARLVDRLKEEGVMGPDDYRRNQPVRRGLPALLGALRRYCHGRILPR